MGGVVVNDEVKLTVAVIGKLDVYAFQKGQEFLMAVALMTSAENPSSGRVVSGQQRKGPVTHIIVGLTLGQTGTQRPRWVGCAPRLESGSSHRHKARWLSQAD